MNQKLHWRRFVARRRRELAGDYPCVAPTHRRRCPRHGASIGPLTGICKPCRDEFYERITGEYVAVPEAA